MIKLALSTVAVLLVVGGLAATMRCEPARAGAAGRGLVPWPREETHAFDPSGRPSATVFPVSDLQEHCASDKLDPSSAAASTCHQWVGARSPDGQPRIDIGHHRPRVDVLQSLHALLNDFETSGRSASPELLVNLITAAWECCSGDFGDDPGSTETCDAVLSDSSAAARTLELQAEGGDAHAQFVLARQLLTEPGSGQRIKDPTVRNASKFRAEEWLARAAAEGDEGAAELLKLRAPFAARPTRSSDLGLP